MQAAFERLMQTLISHYQYDIDTLSQWYIYAPVVPAMLYMAFMLCKWTVFTIPLWAPFAIVVRIFASNLNLAKLSKRSRKVEAAQWSEVNEALSSILRRVDQLDQKVRNL